MTSISVIKRDGSKVPLDITKIHKMTSEACEGLDVSESELQLNARIQFFNGIKTSEIQETLVKSAADLISEEFPDYQFVASRLISYALRKQVFGEYRIKELYEHVVDVVNQGFYEPKLLEWYSREEWNDMNGFIDHDRDFTIAYAGMDIWREKYLVRNRATKQYFETPQIAYMLIAATFFHAYPKETRLKYVKEFYDSASTFEISLPTPIMCGLRTPEKQFSSCVLIEVGDDLDSIFSSTHAIGKYIAKRAGIGIGAGALRSIGSKIRNGDTVHTGAFPFYRMFQSAVDSCSQGGVRKGSGNLNFVGWQYEFEDLIVLKNGKGTDKDRLRGLDYTVQLNRLFYERLVEGGEISFFSTSEVPGLYKAFFEDYDKFKFLYEKAEKNPKIRRKTMSALEFFSTIMRERKETGRIYIMNVDHCNTHSAFIESLAPIKMTNLCVEVTLPTEPFNNVHTGEGEIALCTLSAINWGMIKSPKDFERPAKLLVRALDELLTYQDYPVLAGAKNALQRRPLGIGPVGLAHWLAKNNIPYENISKDGLQKVHEWAEAWSYYLIKASIDLAEEKGACELVHHTKYFGGVLPIDTYKKEVDELVEPIYKMNWGLLRDRASKFGIRNSTLMAGMPGETSTLANNATNGVEPVSSIVVMKGDTKQVIPDSKKLSKKYDFKFKQKSPRGYLSIMAVLQKFMDQAISVNTSYNPSFYENEEISDEELIGDLLFHYRYGGKTLYYFNTAPTSDKIQTETEESCESCTL